MWFATGWSSRFCHIKASYNFVFKADPNRALCLILFLSSGYGRSDPELSTVPCQSSATEGDWCYSTTGKSPAEGSPGHPETCLLCTADISGLETHTVRILTHTLRKHSHCCMQNSLCNISQEELTRWHGAKAPISLSQPNLESHLFLLAVDLKIQFLCTVFKAFIQCW